MQLTESCSWMQQGVKKRVSLSRVYCPGRILRSRIRVPIFPYSGWRTRSGEKVDVRHGNSFRGGFPRYFGPPRVHVDRLNTHRDCGAANDSPQKSTFSLVTQDAHGESDACRRDETASGPTERAQVHARVCTRHYFLLRDQGVHWVECFTNVNSRICFQSDAVLSCSSSSRYNARGSRR